MKTFGELSNKELFGWKGQIYQKISEEWANPISYKGEPRFFDRDCPVVTKVEGYRENYR